MEEFTRWFQQAVTTALFLWLNDTAEAPSYINYSQAGYDTYDQRSDRVTLNIRVNNVEEARPDYHFEPVEGQTYFDFVNVDAVLPGTRVPYKVMVTTNGDDPALYNYGHDLQIRFTANDNPGIQHQVTLEWEKEKFQSWRERSCSGLHHNEHSN